VAAVTVWIVAGLTYGVLHLGLITSGVPLVALPELILFVLAVAVARRMVAMLFADLRSEGNVEA
jgi:hypothetical protein